MGYTGYTCYKEYRHTSHDQFLFYIVQVTVPPHSTLTHSYIRNQILFDVDSVGVNDASSRRLSAFVHLVRVIETLELFCNQAEHSKAKRRSHCLFGEGREANGKERERKGGEGNGKSANYSLYISLIAAQRRLC